MFWLLGQRLPETENLTPNELLSAGRTRIVWTPASEYATIAPVGRQPWISWGDNRTGKAVFATIDCDHTTDLGQHICFQMVIFYGCNFANSKDTKNQRMSPFYTLACSHVHTHTHTHTHTHILFKSPFSNVLQTDIPKRTQLKKKNPYINYEQKITSKLNWRCDFDVRVVIGAVLQNEPVHPWLYEARSVAVVVVRSLQCWKYSYIEDSCQVRSDHVENDRPPSPALAGKRITGEVHGGWEKSKFCKRKNAPLNMPPEREGRVWDKQTYPLPLLPTGVALQASGVRHSWL